MPVNLATFLTTLYTIVDDLYRQWFAPHKPLRPGPQPEMSDSEVLTLAILGQWDLHRSERWILRYAGQHWRRYFPRLLTQSALNKRIRDLCGVLCKLGPAVAVHLAQQLSLSSTYQVLDGVAVPLMRRCRGDKHRLFANEAAVGRGGADKDFYYGVKALVAVMDKGLITGFVVGPANTEERFLAEGLFRWRTDPEATAPTAEQLEPVLGPAHRQGGKRKGPSGPISGLGTGKLWNGPYVADLGLAGQQWQDHWQTHYEAAVLTKDAYDDLPPEQRRRQRKWFSGLRQKVETTFSGLEEQMGLWFPRARSYWGLLARLGAKMAAFNLGMAFNYLHQRPPYSRADPFGG